MLLLGKLFFYITYVIKHICLTFLKVKKNSFYSVQMFDQCYKQEVLIDEHWTSVVYTFRSGQYI